MNIILFSVCLAIFCGMVPMLANEPAPKTTVVVKSETITGTLTIVDPAEKMIYLKSAEGIVYDFKIIETTKITAADAKLKFDDLSAQIGKQLEVVFRPLTIGNVAQSVEIK